MSKGTVDDDFAIGLKNDRFYVHETSEFDRGNVCSENGEHFTDLRFCSTDERDDRTTLTGNEDASKEKTFDLSGSSWKSYESMFALVNENPIRFFLTTIPNDCEELLPFRLLRDPDSVMPMFHLQMEFDGGNKHIRLLTAKKQMKVFGGARFNICLSSERSTNLPFAELFCDNVSGTSYILKYLDQGEHQGLALIQYASNFLGFSGPRKFHVFIPKSSVPIETLQEIPNVFDHPLSNENQQLFHHMENKAPLWNENSQSYVLKFQGVNRVSIPSLKNFQLLFGEGSGAEKVVMQHGRMEDHSMSCDFRYPLSILQAFAIALSSIESYLLRE